jgi:enolase-phosphatase E1
MTDATTRAILLDIEGTTTPVEFVYEVLFPFARSRAAEFIRERYESGEMRAALDALEAEHREDDAKGNAPPAWLDATDDARIDSATRYVHWLMDQDRKSTALKSLQGKIWEGGYRSGQLKGQVYADVLPAFERWRAQARSIHIYSSGSVLAQKLLFAHTTEGDLTAYIDGYFDTATGPKKDAASYQSIGAHIGLPASSILFLSDVTAELDAARHAGLQTALCVRPGSDEPEPNAHTVVRTFDVI